MICGCTRAKYVTCANPQIMWAKLGALVDGARLASKELWGSDAKGGAGKHAPRPAA